MEKSQNSVIEREIPLKKALIVLSVSVLTIVLLGIGVGYAFFWNQYDQVTKDEAELRDIKALVQKNPNDYKGYLAMGNYYLRNGDAAEALKLFKQAEKINKDEPLVKFNIGLVYIEEKKYNEAIKLMEPLAKKNIFNFDAQYYTGAAYYLNGDDNKALEYFKNALMFNEASADTNVWLAKCYYRKGDKTLALEHVNKALRMVPDYDEALQVKKIIDANEPMNI